MRFVPLVLGVLTFSALAAACSDGDDDGGAVLPVTAESPADATETAGDADDTPPGDEPEPAGFSLPDTFVSAPLTDTYDTALGVPPADDTLPVPPGSVVARWYQSDGLLVIHYDGLDLAITGPLCPGNSILTITGFEFISNAPTGAGACSTATTVAEPPTGVRLCGDEVLYLTAIPVETEGTLYGTLYSTLERYREDGSIIGLTSGVNAAGAASFAPEVDISSCVQP